MRVKMAERKGRGEKRNKDWKRYKRRNRRDDMKGKDK